MTQLRFTKLLPIRKAEKGSNLCLRTYIFGMPVWIETRDFLKMKAYIKALSKLERRIKRMEQELDRAMFFVKSTDFSATEYLSDNENEQS